MATAIRNFTPQGGAVAGYSARPAGLTQGKRDPLTGKVYKYPTLKHDSGLTGGGAVKILNPRALSSRVARRHATIGFGLLGSQTY